MGSYFRNTKYKCEPTYYTVYLSETDEVVASGYAEECAEQLKMTPHSFYSMISRVKSGANRKYEVDISKR